MSSAIGDLTTLQLVYAASVLMAASYVRGYSGFGFSAVLVAGLSFVMDPVEAVPLAFLFEVFASVVQGRSVWADVRWKDCSLLLVAAFVGNPIGGVLLTEVDQALVRGATLFTLLFLTVALLRERASQFDPPTRTIFVVGLVAGIVNGATAMAGLVIVLAMSFTTIRPAAMRATLIVYFFVSDIAALVALGARDELTQTLFSRGLLGIPILTLGIFVGSKAFRRASLDSFRRATLSLLLGISIVGLIRLVI